MTVHNTALLTNTQALIAPRPTRNNQAMLDEQRRNSTERLAALLREDLARGKVDRKRLAAECGVTPQAISNWIETGRITKGNLAIVAKYTGRPLSDYMGTDDAQGSGQSAAFVVREPAATYNVQPPRSATARPVISWVRAGIWEDIVDPFLPGEADRWEVPLYRSGPRSFWLQVDGDSMVADPGEPLSFPDGSLIHCDPDVGAYPGKFVIAKNVELQKATFKKLTTDGMTQFLTPLNRRYPNMPIVSEVIRIIATVTEWRIGGKL